MSAVVRPLLRLMPMVPFIAFSVSQAKADEAGAADAQAVVGPFAGSEPVDASTLDTIAGREKLTLLANSTNSSTVRNNSVNGNSVTGTINLDGQAFQNLAGLAVINANTGNNVSINASMLVNIAISPQQ